MHILIIDPNVIAYTHIDVHGETRTKLGSSQGAAN